MRRSQSTGVRPASCIPRWYGRAGIPGPRIRFGFFFKQKTAYALCLFFFFQAEDGIRDLTVTGVQTCALPIHTSELQSQSNLVCRLLLGVQTCGSEEHTSELQSQSNLVCRLLLEKKNYHNMIKF